MMKVVKVTPNEKVVDFSQSDLKVTRFQRDYPVSDTIRKMQDEIYLDFIRYGAELNSPELTSLLGEYIDDHHPIPEKRSSLQKNLFWWKVLYETYRDDELSCVEAFIFEHVDEFKNKPFMTSWLREWDKAVPKFYYVGVKYSNFAFFVIDILEDEIIEVVVKDPEAISPKQGEIVMGTLVPLGGSLYTPIVDFYHFNYEAREKIAPNLKYYYDRYLKKASMYEAFIHVLSAALQIEYLVAGENQMMKEER